MDTAAIGPPSVMAPFTFQTVGKIVFEPGGASTLADSVRSSFPGVSSVLIVSDRGVENAGLLEVPTASLNRAGIKTEIYADVVADPPVAVIEAATKAAKKVDLVIGFGGGSSMDAAKLAAVLAKGEQKLEDMWGVDKVTSSRLPLMLVPTTSGTGSEVTPISVVTTGGTTKLGVNAPPLYCDVAFLDPDLTLGLPAHVTAATGIDAMVHAIEAYTSKIKKNPTSDTLIFEALKRLYWAVPAAYEDGSNREARSAAMYGAMLAGQAFANAPVGAVHAMAYPLGGHFHLSHGLSNALVLPYVLAFNLDVAEQHYADIGSALGLSDAGSTLDRANAFIDAMTALCERVGVRKPLRSFGITEADLPVLAADVMIQQRLLVNNPKDLTEEDALRIYEQAF